MKEYQRSYADQFIMEKQSMEVGLAFDVLEVFDNELIQSVRDMCKASIVLVDDSPACFRALAPNPQSGQAHGRSQ